MNTVEKLGLIVLEWNLYVKKIGLQTWTLNSQRSDYTPRKITYYTKYTTFRGE